MTYTLSPHLVEQARAKKIALAAIHAILANPSITYGSFRTVNGKREPYRCRKCGSEQQKITGSHEGQALCIPACTKCRVAVTVWEDQVETGLRADQKAKGVTRYRGRNGEWRS